MENDKTTREAVELLYRKAMEGDAEAQLEVARSLTYTDPADSLQFYRRAAGSGHLRAQYELAVRLLTDRRELKEAVHRHKDSSKGLSVYQELNLIAIGPEFEEAFEWLEKAALAGQRDAQFTLGALYEKGQGVQENPVSSREWYAKAAESGHPHAQYQMGLLCALDGESDDVSWFRAAAEQGHLESAFLLASWLSENGRAAEAAEWYRRAVESGHHKSEFSLGFLLATELDRPEEGARWIRGAAERGEPEAQRNLAAMYAMGLGVPKDERESAHWYRLAAEQGHPEGQFRVGVMHYHGEHLPADFEKSVEWLWLAVQQGHERAGDMLVDIVEEMSPDKTLLWHQRMADVGFAEAHDRLGLHYSGLEDRRAVDHFRAAAESGHLSGQYNLGVMYFQGTLIEQDDETAISWFRKAADAGFPKACHNMGALLEETDFEQAVEYYQEAARLGVPEAQARLAELGPREPEGERILQLCHLIVNLSIQDQAEAFRLQPGSVLFLVEGTWQEVMSPPEHIAEPLLQCFRKLAGMGPEETESGVQISIGEGANYLLNFQFEKDMLQVDIKPV